MTAWTRHREKGHGGKTSTVPGKPRHSNCCGLGCSSSCGPPRGQCFFGSEGKTCQRIRVKSYQNVGFRSSIDYTFWAQPFVVTTHSRFVFLNQTVKDAKIYRCHPMSSVRLQGNIQQIHCNERKKQLGLRGFSWLCMPLSVVLELNLRILDHFGTSTFSGTIYPASGGKNEAVNAF